MSVKGPPLGLTVEVTSPDGSVTRWSSHGRAQDRPTGISFRTKRGDGFADAGCTLPRRIDGEYVDLGLLRDIKLIGEDGSIAYEGRVTGLPRSMDAQHQISVQAAGWMAHATDRRFREIYVDSDTTKWKGPSTRLKVANWAGGYDTRDPESEQGSASPSITTAIRGTTTAGNKPVSHAVYDALGIPLGELFYTWVASSNIDTANTNYNWNVALANDDLYAGTVSSLLRFAGLGNGSGSLTTTQVAASVARLEFFFNAAFTVDGTATINWTKLQLMGRHGLTRRDAASGLKGLYVSDIIRDISARFAPKLNTAGVQDTTFILEQYAVFDPVTPYDAFLALNAYHRWNLSVWENRTLTFATVDLTDYDWEIRLGDPGVTIDLQGDSAADLANGIAVSYTDITTGRAARIDPVTTPELADTSVENPANQAGIQVWTEISLSFPVTAAMALQLGRAALAEFNSPKTPGTIKVTGHIRDRAGHLQPAWKVRADDRVSIVNYINDSPRQIVETSYDHSTQSVQISVDAPAQRLDAVLDRITTSLSAAGIG